MISLRFYWGVSHFCLPTLCRREKLFAPILRPALGALGFGVPLFAYPPQVSFILARTSPRAKSQPPTTLESVGSTRSRANTLAHFRTPLTPQKQEQINEQRAQERNRILALANTPQGRQDSLVRFPPAMMQRQRDILVGLGWFSNDQLAGTDDINTAAQRR